MEAAGQTPHGARPNRGGRPSGRRAGSVRHNFRVGRWSRTAMHGLEEWSPCRSLSSRSFECECPIFSPLSGKGGFESLGEKERQTEFGLQVQQLHFFDQQVLRCAQDFGCVIPLRSRPQTASTYRSSSYPKNEKRGRTPPLYF